MNSNSDTIYSSLIVSSDVIYLNRRLTQNCLLIWLDSCFDKTDKDYQNIFEQLKSVINNIEIFTEPTQCVQFLNEIRDEKTFVITTGYLGQYLISDIHSLIQLDSIYILCRNKSRHEQWTKQWNKIQGVFTEIKSLCERLKLVMKETNQNSIPMSFVITNDEKSNELEASFMYTQIFKEILLEMKHKKQEIKDLANYCRKLYSDNKEELKIINEFERNYCPEQAIWWYTRECFTYQMLNRALRLLEADKIINMGFFIHDLHLQIEQLHKKQLNTYNNKTFLVYRGQGLLNNDFDKLFKTKGGLLSFNNFLSTSNDREISLSFAQNASSKTNTTGILFVMTIDPSIISSPFASIRENSYFETEEEILFSMHTIFRIGQIEQLDKTKRLYQVNLQLTNDNDEQLRLLTKRIREEIIGTTNWRRLSCLLLKIGQYNKAEELYNVLLEQKTSDENDKALYFNELGYIKQHESDWKKAIWYYEKANGIIERTLSSNHPDLATSYNNIGSVYDKMGEYFKAISFYEKALEIREKIFSPDLVQSYNNIGLVYQNIGDYSKAHLFYEKVIEIFEKTLPQNHPDLASSYNNIGGVYSNIGEYSKALLFYEKTLKIYEKSLPANHPLLATSLNNIGMIYHKMEKYSDALSYHEKALEIRQKVLPLNHSDFAQSYNNIGLTYYKMKDYTNAILFYEKALVICRETLPENHPHSASSYNNIGSVYDDMGEYTKALSFYHKTCDIFENILPENHPFLITIYNNMSKVYFNMTDYSKSLFFYEKTLNILEKTLPSNHPDLASSYNSIAWIYRNMNNFTISLLFYQRALDIFKTLLPFNHPIIENIQTNIEFLKSSNK